MDDLLIENPLIDENNTLQDRLKKASSYYGDSINQIKELLTKVKYETDNKSIKNSINESFNESIKNVLSS